MTTHLFPKTMRDNMNALERKKAYNDTEKQAQAQTECEDGTVRKLLCNLILHKPLRDRS